MLLKNNRQNRYSQQEKIQILKKYYNSKLKKIDFCNQENISKTSLNMWLKENKINVTPEPVDDTPKFVPINLSQKKLQVNQLYKNEKKLFLKLNIKNKLEISIPEGFDVTYLSNLILGLAK